MTRAPLLAWLVALPLACGTDQPTVASGTGGQTDDDNDDNDNDDSDSEDDESDSNDSSVDPSGSTGDPGGTDSDSDSDTNATGEDLPPPPATGIQIVDVTADQAIRVPIAHAGALIEGSQRNVPLLQDRATVIRAFYELDETFEPRDIFATLYVQQTDGTETEYTSFAGARHKDCGAESLIDCRYATLGNSFVWRIEPEYVRPGTTYRIDMVETAPGHEEDVSDKVPVFPTDGGSMPIGIEDTYMKMRVVLVPVDHNIGADCPEPPDITADFGPGIDGEDRTVSDFFAERLLAANPADEVEVIPHDVVSFTGSMQGSQLLGVMQNLRFQEGAPPEYYYYAVGRPCDDGPDFAGVAQLGGPTPGQASYRVGWGVYYGNIGSTAGTFVHEIGHEQGRPHIACSGEEAGADPSYPDHPEGDLLSWGIDVMSTAIKVHDPDDHDYMTYCGSTWVSEWAYLKVFPWIQEMSTWETMDAGASTQPLLVGNINADGTEDWYLTEGYMPWTNVTPGHSVQFTRGGLLTGEQPVARVQWEKSEDINVIVPAPADFAGVTGLSLTDAAGNRHVIDRANVRAVAPTAFTAP